MKGEQFFKSLKVVADAHHGNIYEIIGNLAFRRRSVILGYCHVATDVMFSRLGAKKALTLILSERSQSMLFEAMRTPDWS